MEFEQILYFKEAWYRQTRKTLDTGECVSGLMIEKESVKINQDKMPQEWGIKTIGDSLCLEPSTCWGKPPAR